jgi:presenilin-like A22 family membrane protease
MKTCFSSDILMCYNHNNVILFLQELGLFATTQLIGIFVAFKSRDLVREQDISMNLTVWQIILLLAFFTVFIYLISRFLKRAGGFFRLILGLAIFAGSQTVFSLVFNNSIFSFLAAIVLIIVVFKKRIVFLHNLGIVLAMAGIGAVLGLSLSPISVVILLLILSFYDIIAVYKTRHMVKMAEEMIKSRAISGIVLPQNLKGWTENLQNVRPGGQFMILGSGDLVMPLILIASVIGVHGLASGFVVLFFSLLGLALTYYLFVTQRTRKPMAALPPIAVMSIIGYLVSIAL